MAWLGPGLTPWALSFLSLELTRGCPFLGQFPTGSPLLERVSSTLILLDPLWESMQITLSQSLIKQTIDQFYWILLWGPYTIKLSCSMIGPFEVVLTIPQLLNLHVFTHRCENESKSHQSVWLFATHERVHGISGQKTDLEAIPLQGIFPTSRDRSWCPCIAVGRFFGLSWATISRLKWASGVSPSPPRNIPSSKLFATSALLWDPPGFDRIGIPEEDRIAETEYQ